MIRVRRLVACLLVCLSLLSCFTFSGVAADATTDTTDYVTMPRIGGRSIVVPPGGDVTDGWQPPPLVPGGTNHPEEPDAPFYIFYYAKNVGWWCMYFFTAAEIEHMRLTAIITNHAPPYDSSDYKILWFTVGSVNKMPVARGYYCLASSNSQWSKTIDYGYKNLVTFPQFFARQNQAGGKVTNEWWYSNFDLKDASGSVVVKANPIGSDGDAETPGDDNLTFWQKIQKWFIDSWTNVKNWFVNAWDTFVGWIKSFFVPREGFWGDFFDKIQDFCSEHFGFLYDIPVLIGNVLGRVKDFDPSSTPSIAIPSVDLPLPGRKIHILDAQVYTFDMLSKSPYKTIYTVYQSFVWCLFAFAVLRFGKRTYEQVFGNSGGDSGDD